MKKTTAKKLAVMKNQSTDTEVIQPNIPKVLLEKLDLELLR